MEAQAAKNTNVITELTAEIDRLTQEASDHKTIIGQVNQLVTGQNQEFDFDDLVARLKDKFETQTSDPPKEFFI